MQLYGYSERGLMNAFCYDCFHSSEGEKLLGEFLGDSCFPLLESKPSFGGMCRATFLVEQSLSDFGDCDVILLCDWVDGRKAIIFCEFKRGSGWRLKREWQKFTVQLENNNRENLTSNLFCQLYFKQRLAEALCDQTCESIVEGLEFDEPLNTTRRGTGRRKIGDNQTVLAAEEMIRPCARDAYFLMVTPQEINQDELKLFLQQTNERQTGLRSWSNHRWGHLSLSELRNFCEQNRRAFNHTLSIFEYNRAQLY